MPFRFALESVLHFRRSVEHQEELRLRGAIQAVSRVRHYLEQLDSHRLAQQRALSQRLGDGTTAAELRFEIDCESELTSRRIELARGLAVLEQAKNRQQQILGQAKKAREILEAVHDRRLADHRQQSARQEQRRLDDFVLMRLLLHESDHEQSSYRSQSCPDS